jgi:hypothetical protein
VDYRSVWSFAHVEKLSFKKPVVAGERERPGVARRRTQWTKYQRRIEPERLVFIDETWTKTNMARRKFVVVNWADSLGRSPGGLPYGYEVVREINPQGEPERGKRRINDREAAVICRIFATYVTGLSPQAIAAKLNSEQIPGPRGGAWNASTINGNRRRRDVILWNELYIGRLIYNRERFAKDPETGRRIPKVNPRADWVVVDIPELRIVEQDV